MDEQEEKNQEESSIKQAARKGKDKLKDEGKKQAKKKLIQLIAKNPKVLAVIAIVILVVIVLIILFAGFLYVLNIITSKETSDAKNTAVAISYDGQTGTKENTRIIIKPTNNGTYEISNNFTNEELEEVKRKVRGESNIDTSEFSDFELAVLGALLQNGLDLDSYDDDELHCLPYFLKAESSTQFLDLRKNSEKFDSQGNYVPELLDDLEEEEVPGIILVQRTNTTDNNPTTLEYIQKAEFDKMVNNNDIDVINYFTMTDKGNLLIAKWDHIDVEVEGEYPDNVSEEEKEAERDEDIISTEEINYSQYVKKYTMPFDFLVQLLVITEEPEFCKEIANVVLGSKIVINIQEEETVTVTTEVKDYTVHNKDEKRINYYISPEIEIESNDNYLLNYTTDDEGNDCTNYNTEDFQVTVTTTYTSHSYVFEISEADTWLAHYQKTYQKQEAVEEPENKTTSENKGNYSDNEPTVTTIEDSSATIQDEDVKEFKDSKEKYYRDRITIPEVEVSTSSNNSTPTKTITITPQSMVKSVAGLNNGYTYTGTTDASGNIIYNLPGSIAVTTNATNEIPSIDYIYTLYNDDEYRTTADRNGLTECVVEKLETKTFQKTDIVNNITVNVTRYPADPNPTTRTHIYATKSGKPGRGYGDENTEYEKFLVAYNNNRNAIEQINSVDSWLYEMMEENQNTVNMVDTVKYLLYMYDGINRGVTELDLSLFEPDEFTSFNTLSSIDLIKNFIHYWEGTPKYNADKTKYVIFDDGAGNPTVGWGIAIEAGGYTNVFKAAGYSTEIGAEVDIDFVDALEEEELNECIEYVKNAVGADLTDYQIGALVSRCYQMGKSGAMYTNQHYNSVQFNFKESYNKYWGENDTADNYKKNITDSIYEHELYKNYMAIGTYSNGKEMAGLKRRREGEWQLFYAGYDVSTNSYWSTSNTASIDNINLYNSDGTVNKTAIDNLEKDLTRRVNGITDPEMNNHLSYKQCTWWAYTRATQYLKKFGTKYKEYPIGSNGRSGNGGEWFDYNKKYGWFEYGQEPKANSIVSWSDNSYGHVAYVEAVDNINKKVYISHAGSGTKWFGIDELTFEEVKTLWGKRINGYIYLDLPR